MRFKTKPIEGDAVRWDGTNADELAALAGDRYEGTHASAALVRGTEGELIHVRPGWVVWVVSRPDDSDDISVSSASAWDVWAQVVA